MDAEQNDDAKSSSDKTSHGSFPAPYTTTADNQLQDHWILDACLASMSAMLRQQVTRPRGQQRLKINCTQAKPHSISRVCHFRVDVFKPNEFQEIELLATIYMLGFMTNLLSLSRLAQKEDIGIRRQHAYAALDKRHAVYKQAYNGHSVLNRKDSPSAHPTMSSTELRPQRTLAAMQWHLILGRESREDTQHLPTAAETQNALGR